MIERYASPLPYPPIRVARKSATYARMMLHNLGGRDSEMSAVALYFYDHLITSAQEELSTTFLGIAKTEMHHLDIFGKLAWELGADPRMWAFRMGQQRYWTAGDIAYPGRLGELIAYAIESERETIRTYRLQAQKIDDPGIVSQLSRIILDEELHIRLLERLQKTYVGEPAAIEGTKLETLESQR